jgi:putative ABC transport system permease protein
VPASTRDLRFALRLMRKRPGLSLLVVVTLAAGIGTKTAVVSVVDAFLLRALPLPAADRVVKVESMRGASAPRPRRRVQVLCAGCHAPPV